MWGNDEFQNFYPKFRDEFTRIVEQNCSGIYQQYLAAQAFHNPVCSDVLDCVLEHTRGSTRSDMASASVLLGLTPSILAIMAASTAEISLLSSRRPLLAFVLTFGSPVVNIQRAFTFDDPTYYLRAGSGRARSWSLLRSSSVASSLVVGLEFGLAMGAALNLWTTIWCLSLNTNYTNGCSNNFAIFMWASFPISIHILAKITFDLRAWMPKSTSANRKRRSIIFKWAKDEFTPCAKQQREHLEWRDETRLFILLSWLTSILVIGHLLYGSLAFSSLIFISIEDSVTVIVRIAASAAMCRAILALELAGMREVASSKEILPSKTTDGQSM